MEKEESVVSEKKKKLGFKISWPGSSSKDSAKRSETSPDPKIPSEIAEELNLSPKARKATERWQFGAKAALKQQQAKVVVAQLVETLARDSISPKEFFQKSQQHQKRITTKYFSKQVSSNIDPFILPWTPIPRFAGSQKCNFQTGVSFKWLSIGLFSI